MKNEKALNANSQSPERNEESVGSPDQMYVITNKDRRDIAMDTRKKGWLRYWTQRLQSELITLPQDIQKFLSNPENSKDPELLRVFQTYVTKRVLAKSFEIQKLELMQRLKQDLRSIEHDNYAPEENKQEGKIMLSYDEASARLFVPLPDGSRRFITPGDCVTDHVWGLAYDFAPEVPRYIRRQIQKRLTLQIAREKIGHVYDRELVTTYRDATSPVGTQSIHDLDQLLERTNLIEDLENSSSIGKIAGALAELTVTALLTRISVNNRQLGLKVERSNALEDTVLKYDFKITLSATRGIALLPEGLSREQFVANKRKLGLQLTTADNPDYILQKEKKIKLGKTRLEEYEHIITRNVKDIKLVSVPELRFFWKRYVEWRKLGSPSGGPESLLTREQKISILERATQGLLNLTPDVLESLQL